MLTKKKRKKKWGRGQVKEEEKCQQDKGKSTCNSCNFNERLNA